MPKNRKGPQLKGKSRARQMQRAALWTLAASSPLVIIADADGAVLNVCSKGCKYVTIQSAVNAAVSGDQISIAKGIYTENVAVNGKKLVLDGAGSEFTIVDGSGAALPVFTLGSSGSDTHHVTLQNMTITHGSASVGGGVQVGPGAALILSSSVVIGNRATAAGGGISISTPGGLASTITSSRIEANSAALLDSDKGASVGGGIYVDLNSSLNISSSEIRGNSTHSRGGGLDSEAGSQVTISASDFEGNSANGFFFLGVGQGCGGAIGTDSAISISGSTIAGNFADLGGGVCANADLDKQIVTIAKTTISRNTAGGGQEDVGSLGAGIYANNFSPVHTTAVSLDHVYLSQNQNVTTNTEDDLFTDGAVKVTFTDTIIKDPVNSGCDGASCPK